MIDNPKCPRCDQIETLKHKLTECQYSSRIWTQTFRTTKRVPGNDLTREIVALSSNDTTALTLHAEITQRLLYLKDDANYLIHPRTFVNAAIKDLIVKENKVNIKNELRDLLG